MGKLATRYENKEREDNSRYLSPNGRSAAPAKKVCCKKGNDELCYMEVRLLKRLPHIYI